MIGLLHWPEAMGGWAVDGDEMCGPGWKSLDLEKLWPGPVEVAGENEKLPGQPGRLDRRHEIDEAVVDLAYQIGGAAAQDGTPHPDPLTGLQLNIAALGAICRPPTVGNTKASVLTLPSGATATSAVQLRMSRPIKDGPYIVRCTVTVTMPDGEHEVGGS